MTCTSTSRRYDWRLNPQSNHSRSPKNCPTPWGHFCQMLAHDRLAWPTVDYRDVSCADLAFSAETLRAEIDRLTRPQSEDVAAAVIAAPLWLYYTPMIAGAVVENLDRAEQYRTKLDEFERAMRDKECPVVPAKPED
jgi:hypothetical protein